MGLISIMNQTLRGFLELSKTESSEQVEAMPVLGQGLGVISFTGVFYEICL